MFFVVQRVSEWFCKYYNKLTPIPTQDQMYRGDGLWSWDPASIYTSGLSADDIVEWATYRWGKTGTIATSFSNSVAISEIENNRPFFSMIPGHFRLCRGYIVQDGYTYCVLMTQCLSVRRMVHQEYLNAHTAVQK